MIDTSYIIKKNPALLLVNKIELKKIIQ